MSKIKFIGNVLQELATLNAALSAVRTEKLNSENTLNFTCRVKDSAAAYVKTANLISLDGDYFDVAFLKSAQQGDGLLLYEVQCEHVSYRLNNPDYNLNYFTMTGTPTAILTEILDGTGFTVGTVEFSTSITISILEATSRRALLMYLVSYLGGDLYCNGFAVSILTHRGSVTAIPLTVGKDVSVISKSINKRELDVNGNPIISYACEVYKGAALALGDVVSLDYDVLDIDVSLRIVGIAYDPYNPSNVAIEVGNLSDRLEDDIYRIETQTVAKDKVYHGTRIGPEFGFEVIRSDNKARAVMNSDSFAWQIGDGTGGNWVDTFYYDSTDNKIKFTGDINMLGGSISWNQLSDKPTIPTQYDDEDAVLAIESTFIDEDSVWTIDVYAENIYGNTITGKTLQTAATGQRVVVDGANNKITFYSEDQFATTFTPSEFYFDIRSAYEIRLLSTDGITLSAPAIELGGAITFDVSTSINFSGVTVSNLTVPAVFS